MTVITNVKLMTMDDSLGIIERGWLEFDNGKIVRLGSGDYIGEGGELIDGGGGWLLPGFIDGHTHIGLLEDSLSFEGDDINEASDPVTPQLRGIDALNPFDRCFEEARESGVTCVAAGPGSANPIGGQFCCVKTVGKRVDDMTLMAPVSMKFAMGENPKNVYHGKNQSPETRMATAALIREQLFKAQKYAYDIDRANEDDEDAPDEPDFDIKNEALVPVIKRKLTAHFHAHRADDIFTAIRIAKEFDLDYVIVHCTDGYLVADELKKDGVRAFVGPNICDRSKPELKSLSFDNPRALDEAGILIGLTTDHPVIPLNYLPLCAALAVRNGMKPYNAFKAITINPAKILGVDDRVGSLTPGKDADLVLYDESPFDVMSRTSKVYIDGKLVFGGK